jgi:hypothetical protein
METVFLALTLIALSVVCGIDTAQKRREFLREQGASA